MPSTLAPTPDHLPQTSVRDDPRHRNEKLDTSSLGAFVSDYADRLKAALLTVDVSALEAMRSTIVGAAEAGRRIFAIGNGGSAAIADHLGCDWTKGTHVHAHPTIDVTSMTANGALYSAIANDYGFEKVFAAQVELLGKEGDVLVAISSSGDSPNILNAVQAAKALGMRTIGLSGFAGGRLKDAVDVSVCVDAKNYGLVEDAHQAIMHILAQFIVSAREA